MGNMDMEATMGFLGEKMLVNGQADFTLLVATRVYRLRLLNGSVSRYFAVASLGAFALVAAAVAQFGLLLAVNFIGDAVRDVLDPRLCEAAPYGPSELRAFAGLFLGSAVVR